MYTTFKWLVGGIAAAALFVMPVTRGLAETVPDTVQLDSLSNLYGPVTFDHSAHIDIAGSCAVCHHHGTGAPVEDENCARCHSNSQKTRVLTCQECHPVDPFSAEYLREREMDKTLYHRDKPGLKAAYHLNCLGCHQEMDGPTGCQDCHVRTEAGDAFFHADAYAPNAEGEGSGHH
jgi:hypothetical protein